MDGQSGEVLLYNANITSGALGARTQVLAPGGRSDFFGAALARVNARACLNGPPELACGEELLVGAPEEGDGNVCWFQNQLASLASSYQLGGTLPRPTAAGSAGSTFGSAIATHPDAGWIAVADALDQTVYIYRFDATSTSATPLSLESTDLASSDVGATAMSPITFGSSLVMGDFDGDGNVDLAVGSVVDTTGTNHGRVDIFSGNGSGSGLPIWTP